MTALNGVLMNWTGQQRMTLTCHFVSGLQREMLAHGSSGTKFVPLVFLSLDCGLWSEEVSSCSFDGWPVLLDTFQSKNIRFCFLSSDYMCLMWAYDILRKPACVTSWSSADLMWSDLLEDMWVNRGQTENCYELILYLGLCIISICNTFVYSPSFTELLTYSNSINVRFKWQRFPHRLNLYIHSYVVF